MVSFKKVAIYYRHNELAETEIDRIRQDSDVSEFLMNLNTPPAEVKIFEDSCACYQRKRKGLSALLDEVRKSKIKKVVVYAYHRIAENPHQLLQLNDLFRKNGVEFFSVKEPTVSLEVLSALRDSLISEKVATTLRLKKIKDNLKRQKRLQRK